MSDIDVTLTTEVINVDVTPVDVITTVVQTTNNYITEEVIVNATLEPAIVDVAITPIVVEVSTGEVPAHEAMPDPHTQYLLETVAEATYSKLGHNHDNDTLRPDVIVFEPPAIVPTEEGAVFWDTDAHVLAFKPDLTENTLQIGLEEWVRVKNLTGGPLINGTAIVANSVDGGVLTITKALAVPGPYARTTAILTSDLAHGQEGFCTVRGIVHDMDTTGLTPFANIYVSDTIAGGLTNTAPIAPNYAIPLGYALDASLNGTMYVNSSNPVAIIRSTDASYASKDPTGFNFTDSVAISYDSVTRKITLTGTLKYSWMGSVLELNSPWVSDAHPATLDTNYYLYSIDGKTFTWSTTVWEFHHIQVAAVWYGSSEKYALRETHGLMGWQSHEEFHQNIGTYKRSGGTLSNYVLSSTTPANRRPYIDTTVVKDEDLVTTNSTHTSTLYSKLYLTSTGISTFTLETAEIVPIAGAIPYWNQFSAGTWVQTPMTNNSYMSVWLVAAPMTSDTESQKLRYFWVQGQSNGTLATEQALYPTNLNLGQLATRFTEFTFIVKVILRYQGGDWTINEVTNLSGNRATTVGSPSGTFLSVVNHDTNFTGTGVASSPLALVTIPTLTNIKLTGFNSKVYQLYIDANGNIGTEEVI